MSLFKPLKVQNLLLPYRVTVLTIINLVTVFLQYVDVYGGWLAPALGSGIGGPVM